MGNTILCPVDDSQSQGKKLKSLAEKSGNDKYFVAKVHVDILLGSWKDVEAVGVIPLGALIFTTLFKINPESFHLFSFFHDENWEASQHFKHHCKVFVNVIGSTIRSLDKPDVVKHRMGYLGYMHKIRDTTDAQFDLAHDIMLNSLEQLLPKEKWSIQHKEAWSVLYKAMQLEMMKDFEDAGHLTLDKIPTLPAE